mmetsp:Transcript_8808/g.11842  ORF Transcript_8808/g.11842 Transcript_8808/m.11842 type:complete len:103 (-) Transcript_8808:66-374(-)
MTEFLSESNLFPTEPPRVFLLRLEQAKFQTKDPIWSIHNKENVDPNFYPQFFSEMEQKTSKTSFMFDQTTMNDFALQRNELSEKHLRRKRAMRKRKEFTRLF